MSKQPEPNQTEPIQTEPILSAIPDGWITKPEAVRLSNRSLKRFEHAANSANLESKLVANAGTRPIRIYRRSDVEPLARPERPPTLARLNDPAVRMSSRPAAPPLLAGATAAPKAPAIPIDRMHLVSMAQAHQLGYPIAFLRELKRRPNPPGVAYGKRGFRFSVPALRLEMERIG